MKPCGEKGLEYSLYEAIPATAPVELAQLMYSDLMVPFEKEVHWYWVATSELEGRNEHSDVGW